MERIKRLRKQKKSANRDFDWDAFVLDSFYASSSTLKIEESSLFSPPDETDDEAALKTETETYDDVTVNGPGTSVIPSLEIRQSAVNAPLPMPTTNPVEETS